METVAISQFKAKCLALLERVRRTGEPILVTRRGQAIAQIVPPSAPRSGRPWLGSLSSTGRITGDIVSPASERSEWDALRS